MKLNATMKKLMVPVGILVMAVVIAQIILSNPPQAKRRGPSKAPQMTVEVNKLEEKVYQVQLDSFGTVRPRTESVLVSQAAGQINFISDNFRDGGFFEKGELLLKLDDRDIKADVKIAQANLLDAKQQFAEEQARAKQALTDWQRLGKQGTPNDLVLRKPQLEAAKARQLSSEAQLAKAQLALERTEIVAPYAGRVLAKKVDLGQVVSNNSQLADIYAVDFVEIRLPIKNQDLALVDLPEEFRGHSEHENTGNRVRFSSGMGEQQWIGTLVRTEGAIDEQTQQLYVVAQIADPYAVDTESRQQTTIKIGQYVSAEIAGKLLSNALVIPTKSIYQGSYVYVVEEGVLMRREVTLLWKNETEAVIKSGLNVGDRLVTTALGQVSSGTPVSVSDERRMTKGKSGSGDLKQKLARMPEPRRKKLEAQAKQQGISIEQLIKERQKQQNRQQRMANGG